jgi:hypothetical protein
MKLGLFKRRTCIHILTVSENSVLRRISYTTRKFSIERTWEIWRAEPRDKGTLLCVCFAHVMEKFAQTSAHNHSCELLHDAGLSFTAYSTDFYTCLANFIQCMEGRMKWVGHVARMGEMRNAYEISVGNLKGHTYNTLRISGLAKLSISFSRTVLHGVSSRRVFFFHRQWNCGLIFNNRLCDELATFSLK